MSKTFHYLLHTFEILGLILACGLIGTVIQQNYAEKTSADEFRVQLSAAVKDFAQTANCLLNDSNARIETIDNQARVLRVESDRYSELQGRTTELLETAQHLKVVNDDLSRINGEYKDQIRYLTRALLLYKKALEIEKDRST